MNLYTAGVFGGGRVETRRSCWKRTNCYRRDSVRSIYSFSVKMFTMQMDLTRKSDHKKEAVENVSRRKQMGALQ